MTTGNGDLVGWVKEKFGLGPRPYVPPPYIAPVRFNVPAPVPATSPRYGPPLVPTEQPVASLVGTHNNSKGRAMDTGSLVGGR